MRTAAGIIGQDGLIARRGSGSPARFRRSLFYVLGILFLLTIAATFWHSRKDGSSRLFAELQEGMTFEEVQKVFFYTDLKALDPMPKEWGYYVDCQDSEWLPPVTIEMHFVDGHLEKKHMFRPSVSFILSFWWHRLSRL